MDFKKLAQYVMILGVVILAVGGIMFSMNQPVSAKKTASGNYFEQMGQQINAMDENMSRASKREDAQKILIAGGVVLFVGIAVSASAKKKNET